ncbi:ParA family protein [Selenomonas sp. AE3005]|uniref:ParA family protein n=1 Tax=Selenomonas sp. AE3005 TaxID=1485543 RepID=UPI0025CE666B|nr:ParA family protein [Selenomonas sp. AE3005]
MKVLTIANLKGGVGKTVTTINASYLLATEHGKRVLLVDNDQQGNCSQFFGVYGYDKPSMTDVMKRRVTAEEVIQRTEYEGLDIIPANLSLAEAEKAVLMDSTVPQQVRLKEILRQVKDDYDYVLIDNAPSLGMCVINALATSDYLIIPAKIDKFTFDGIDCLLNQLKTVKEYFNPQIELLGTLITSYRRNDTNQQGAEWLKQAEKYKVFDTIIRWTDKVDESTFTAEPVMIHSPRCGAARDYKAFVAELVKMVEG